MKRIISLIAAAVMAIFSLTSCEDVIEALLNNYTVGDQVVLVGCATVEHSLIGHGICLMAKDKGVNTSEVFTVLMTEAQLNELFEKGTLDINTTDFSVSGGLDDGKTTLCILSKTYVGGSYLEDKYENEPVSCEAILTAHKSGDHLTFKCRAKIVLALKEDSTQTKEFALDCNYNGEFTEITRN